MNAFTDHVYDFPPKKTEYARSLNCGCSQEEAGSREPGAPLEADLMDDMRDWLKQASLGFTSFCKFQFTGCNFGAQFTEEVVLMVEYEGADLNDNYLQKVADAMTAASNDVYAVTRQNCLPQYRKFQAGAAMNLPYRRNLRQVEASSIELSSSSSVDRHLQKKKRPIKITVSGVCNFCDDDNYYGYDVDSSKKTRRQLEEAWSASNCYCPLESTIETHTPSKEALINALLDHLKGGRIKNVTDIIDLRSQTPPPTLAPIPRTLSGTAILPTPAPTLAPIPPIDARGPLRPTLAPIPPTPPPVQPTPAPIQPTMAPVRPTFAPIPPTPPPVPPTPAPVWPTMAPVRPTPAPVWPTPAPLQPTPFPVSLSTTASPPIQSTCPLVTLNFMDIPNPMARYYGQPSMLSGGDYLFDQLWWTHGVKVSGRIRLSSHTTDNRSDVIIAWLYGR